ncbi:MAG: PfaD family polyunsaturated fatty acid/polyketide biosynthesis protein [Desulfarculaceae bacterium]|nr:PfaD family polyunsaturated fatty acid/polyketide biosynthesis protein [Desulfarculaceae bacterium]
MNRKPNIAEWSTSTNMTTVADKNGIVKHLFDIETPFFLSEGAFVPALPIENLGDREFLARHNMKYPYIAGAMANGITGERMVKAMAENGMAAFFGSGGLSLERIEQAIRELKETLHGKPFGFNLIHSPSDPDHEMAVVELYLQHGISLVSAAAFMRMTLPLVYYRIKGLHTDVNGRVVAANRIIAKVSRVEVADRFFSPPPEKLVQKLYERGLVTEREKQLSRYIPMAHDLTAEADSGGHTDNRPALTLLPTMLALKEESATKYQYTEPLCVGLAGGISTPQAAAAAFQMGAAYILTGSVNQSCVEADISEDVKQLLALAQQADVAMAPSADMFEIGARVQVLKRGTMFPLKAEKLYGLYRAHARFEDIPEKERKHVEEKILMSGFETEWHRTKEFFKARGNQKEIEKAQSDPKHKMALVFRSYLGLASKWAVQGKAERKMDYQIWCGPAMGAFNQWVNGSFLELPQNRETAVIALNILFGAAVLTRAAWVRQQGITLPGGHTLTFHPVENILSGLP